MLPLAGTTGTVLALGNFIWPVRISRADVADFMLKQIADDGYIGTTVAVYW